MPSFLVKGLTVATSLLFASQSLCQELSPPCPLEGAVYKAPSQPSKSEAIIKAKEAFEAELVRAFKSDEESTFGTVGYQNSFSVELYSIHESEALHTHHWTAPQVPTTSGQKNVDGNSIFRVGSISKLITTYIYLINAGFKGWNDPITDYVPQLKEYAEKSKTDPLNVVDWDEVTVGGLVSHLAGITTDGAPPPSTDVKLAAAGLPKVQGVPGKFCGNPEVQEFPCDDEEFIKDLNFRHPVLQTFADSPIYSNTAWRLVTMALEKITESKFPDLFQKSFVDKLGLNSTTDHLPESDESSYIPINSNISWYNADLHAYTPGGGYWSSVNDLRKIGASILNASLISSSRTRHWMKPAVFTSNPNATVGAPWESYLAPLKRHSWMYTKSGDLGTYSSHIILLREYDVGLTIMTAGYNASKTSRILADMATAVFVPALEQATKENAAAVFAGTYSDEKTNSTIALAVLDDEPGLVVTQWSVDGLDVLPLIGALQKAPTAAAHLYPTGLESKDGKQIGWRAIFEAPQPASGSLFGSPCMSWFSADRIVYGGVGAGEFVFQLNEAGDAAEGLDFKLLGMPLVKTADSLLKMVKSA